LILILHGRYRISVLIAVVIVVIFFSIISGRKIFFPFALALPLA